MTLRPAAILLLTPLLLAGEDAGAPATATAPAAKAPAAAPAADPTSAVIAEGRFVYRQRDIDALTLIALRHAKAKLTKADEDQLRQVIAQALLAREPLLAALDHLPAAMGKGREQIVLDLLSYQADAAAAPNPAGTAGKAGGTAAAPAVITPAAGDSDLLVRLPPLTMARSLAGIGKRQMTIGLALYFHDGELGKRLEAKAPLIQDAVLGHLQGLPPTQFAEPDQAALKDGLAKAIIARVPEFPADGVLIPQLEVAGDGQADARAATPAAPVQPPPGERPVGR